MNVIVGFEQRRRQLRRVAASGKSDNSRLKVFAKALAIPFDSGERVRVKHRSRLKAAMIRAYIHDLSSSCHAHHLARIQKLTSRILDRLEWLTSSTPTFGILLVVCAKTFIGLNAIAPPPRSAKNLRGS